jgi:hypothetical protein
MIRDSETLLTHLEPLSQAIWAFLRAADSEEGLKPSDVQNLQFQLQTLEQIVDWSAIEQEVEDQQEQQQLEAEEQISQDWRDYWSMTAGSLARRSENIYY